MRYLFGDSTPFPLGFDFLRTLEAFMNAGTRVVLVEQEARRAASDAHKEQTARAVGRAVLERFHDATLAALSTESTPDHPFAQDYAKRVAESARSFVEERKRDAQAEDERADAHARAERARADDEGHKHLSTFFLSAELPVLETRLATKLTAGRPEASATLTYPSGVGASFRLRTPWQAPRRIGELLEGHLDLNVAVKKAWIGGKVTREPMRLDDWLVGSAELGPTTAVVALRKKADQKDGLVFELRRDLGVVSATVAHPGDPNAAQLPSSADAADLPHLERLWSGLVASFDAVLGDRAAVTSITLDAEVFGPSGARGRAIELVERLVTVLAPTALEIANRSPNARELSLKRETEGGRREELYLKRSELQERVAPLSRDGREVFAALGLDEWVPSLSLRPPSVAVVPRESEPRSELVSIDIEEA